MLQEQHFCVFLSIQYIELFVLFASTNVYIYFSEQRQCTAVTPFRLQVLNTATVLAAQHHLLVQTAQVQPVIVTVSPIKY